MSTSIDFSTARETVRRLPSAELGRYPTWVEELPRLREALRCDARLVVKRDDLIPFAFGGNKVRKLQLLAAEALAAGADTLVTTGSAQSNHARVTAAAAARLGLRCALVLSGPRPDRLTANLLLDELFGAELHFVETREARAEATERLADTLHEQGRRPFVIPLGGSTVTGALAYVRAVGELAAQMTAPKAIVHASSSGGTQAGIIAGCLLHGWDTRVVGISADERAPVLAGKIRSLLAEIERRLELPEGLIATRRIDVDDRFVGAGYGAPTDASREALRISARTDTLILDPVYTAKAMAGFMNFATTMPVGTGETLLFWHTGGQVGLFA